MKQTWRKPETFRGFWDLENGDKKPDNNITHSQRLHHRFQCWSSISPTPHLLPCSLLQEPPSVAFQFLAILNKIQQRECHAPTRIAIHIKHSPHVCWLPRKHWQKEEKQNFLFFIWKPSYLIRSVVGGFCFGVSNNEKSVKHSYYDSFFWHTFPQQRSREKNEKKGSKILNQTKPILYQIQMIGGFYFLWSLII